MIPEAGSRVPAPRSPPDGTPESRSVAAFRALTCTASCSKMTRTKGAPDWGRGKEMEPLLSIGCSFWGDFS
ncbi:hypothetical protein M758_4G114000 [Ceratodon purpureus]|nr:hypothetical protein M758_4G114000 [Ceratodon purpureus]